MEYVLTLVLSTVLTVVFMYYKKNKTTFVHLSVFSQEDISNCHFQAELQIILLSLSFDFE